MTRACIKSRLNRGQRMTYAQRKEMARNEAIEWSHDYCNHDYSYGELMWFQDYFTALARRYGLVREFKAESII